MLDTEKIILKYYDSESKLYDILTVHSRLVAQKALQCADKHQLEIDREFVYEAAMLHDIGILRCDAEGIECHGSEPYIRHGIIGAEMLRKEGLPRHALVCERHTGAGLTIEDIITQQLPLPHRDMTPQTTEEKLICYADKFYSKSGDYHKEKSREQVVRSMSRHGEDTLQRFLRLDQMFG